MATVLSHAESLLVVREQRSNLPNLTKLGSLAPENVVVVAQMQGEAPEAFVSRVLGRCRRGVALGHTLQTAVVCVDADVTPSALEARRDLLLTLAELLVLRPDAELILSAPSRIGSSDQMALFELVELLLRAAPSLNVRLSFGDPTSMGNARRRGQKPARQPAAA
jgi:hypothetical protein